MGSACWLIAFSDDSPGMGNPLPSSLAWLLAGGCPSLPRGPLCGSAQDSSLPEASHRERACVWESTRDYSLSLGVPCYLSLLPFSLWHKAIHGTVQGVAHRRWGSSGAITNACLHGHPMLGERRSWVHFMKLKLRYIFIASWSFCWMLD